MRYERKSEYGGYLPLELNSGTEMFERYSKYLKRFNSVKASFQYIIEQEKPLKIMIPYYYCPSTTEALKQSGVDISFYHISSDLCPEKIPDEKENLILLVDYFGVKTEDISRIAKQYEKAAVIIDYAHSFFAEPIFQKNIYNVYSARKFLGVPDGSYVVAEGISISTPELANSCAYAGYLLKAYECGVNAAYHEKKAADQIIAEQYTGMSKLTVGLLKNVDYENVKNRRIKNYRVLHQELGNINELLIPQECPAYQYPLLISDHGEKIKSELVKKKIFVSTLWKGKELLEKGNEFEINMSDNAVFLPIDQRYDEEDMRFLANTVLEMRKNIAYG